MCFIVPARSSVSGTVDKYANHKSYGFTDFCSVISDLLFTSSFDLDTGVGSINGWCVLCFAV